jgi:hypothetical protein
MRELWPDAIIDAIDIRPEEEAHLRRNADTVRIGDALELAKHFGDGEYDAAIDNIPFSLMREFVDAFLRVAHDCWFFAPYDALIRGEDTTEWLRTNAKWLQRVIVVPGAIGFRGPGSSSDFRQYALWCFSADRVRSKYGWDVELLPWLDGADRKWVTRPGTEAV